MSAKHLSHTIVRRLTIGISKTDTSSLTNLVASERVKTILKEPTHDRPSAVCCNDIITGWNSISRFEGNSKSLLRPTAFSLWIPRSGSLSTSRGHGTSCPFEKGVQSCRKLGSLSFYRLSKDLRNRGSRGCPDTVWVKTRYLESCSMNDHRTGRGAIDDDETTPDERHSGTYD